MEDITMFSRSGEKGLLSLILLDAYRSSRISSYPFIVQYMGSGENLAAHLCLTSSGVEPLPAVDLFCTAATSSRIRSPLSSTFSMILSKFPFDVLLSTAFRFPLAGPRLARVLD